MKRSVITAVVLSSLIGLAATPRSAQACSAFSFTETAHTYVAKNYDWAPMHGHGAIYVNKRGVAKTAQTLRTENSVQWTSRFGSITFSQMGIEFPLSGINEAGLVGEILQLNATVHIPETDPRPALNEAQWLQYQLDNFATLSEVLAHVDQIRVEQAFLGVHYFLCDKTGECGTFEFLDGKLVVHSGSTLAPKVLTNSTYEESVDYLNNQSDIGYWPEKIQTSLWNDKHPSTRASNPFSSTLVRFETASKMLRERVVSPQKSVPVSFAFDILKEVEMATFLLTQWSLVYDSTAGSVTYHTRENPKLKTIAIDSFDYSCATPSLMADIQQSQPGDVSARLHPFNYEANKNHIDQNWMLMGPELRKLAADYPATMTRCAQP